MGKESKNKEKDTSVAVKPETVSGVPVDKENLSMDERQLARAIIIYRDLEKAGKAVFKPDSDNDNSFDIERVHEILAKKEFQRYLSQIMPLETLEKIAVLKALQTPTPGKISFIDKLNYMKYVAERAGVMPSRDQPPVRIIIEK